MENTPPNYARQQAHKLTEAMRDTPVVVVTGPRQSGKTTLVRDMSKQGLRYLTLDDGLTLLSAQEDPQGMIQSLDRAIIDEIQRAPQLLLAIKKSVDEDRRPGRFLVTGSANLMTLPKIADSLAGRMEALTLLPLSQSELHHQSSNWVDAIFAGQQLGVTAQTDGADLIDRLMRGGYPEMQQRNTPRRRTAWARQYLDAILSRDVRDLAEVDKLDQLPPFLRALAHLSGQLCNYSQLGAQMGLSHKTAARYIGLFEQMYLVSRVDVWARNRLQRVIKTPKLHFLDTGLLAVLGGHSSETLSQDRQRLGPLLESFVYGELRKLMAVAQDDYQLLYYRDHDQTEVDFVIENPAGNIVGIEVKAAASVNAADLRGLRKLSTLAGDAFKGGVVLYNGTESLPLGQGLWAMPISGLWGCAPSRQGS